MLKSTRARYGLIAQSFHWATAALILFLIPLGIYMHELPQGTEAEITDKLFLYSLHKSVGIAALAVAVLRILWALINPKPAPLHPDRKAETLAAETVHWLLYASIIAVPVTGWLHHAATDGFAPIWWFTNQDLPFVPNSLALEHLFGAMHFFFAVTLVISLVLHIAGAIKHAVIDKDQTLTRMVPGRVVTQDVPDVAHKHGAPLLLAGLVLMGALGVSFASVTLSGSGQGNAELAATSGEWQVRSNESTLAIEIDQNGSPVSGGFANWSADITFDPDNLAAASVRAEIDVSSLTLGSVTGQALSSDFLDATTHPLAVFASNDFQASGEGTYVANGTLELSGASSPVSLPFSLTIEGDVARMEGAVDLNRMDFGVGAEGFANEGSVGFTVPVRISIVADRAG